MDYTIYKTKREDILEKYKVILFSRTDIIVAQNIILKEIKASILF
jgi:hypothetical protein